MPLNKESQDPDKVNKTIKRPWIRYVVFSIVTLTALSGLSLLFIIAYITTCSVNLAPLLRYWMPLSVVSGSDKDHPAGRLTLDRLTMEWPVWRQGISAPLVFEVQQLKLIDIHGKVRDHLDHGFVTVRTGSLFKGKIVPLSLDISGAAVYLRHQKEHQIILDLPDQGNHDHTVIPVNFQHLSHIQLHNVVVQLVDDVQHRMIRADPLDIDIHPFYDQKHLAPSGYMKMNIHMGDHSVQINAYTPIENGNVHLRGQIKETGQLRWHVQLSAINPADFASFMPGMQLLNKVNLPISTEADILFDVRHHAGSRPVTLQMNIHAKQGKVRFQNQDFYPASLIGNINAQFPEGLKGKVLLTVQSIALQLRSPARLDDMTSGPAFLLKGDLNLSNVQKPGKVDLDLTASSPLLDFSSLKDYWPSTVARGAYHWVTDNITDGKAYNFSVHAGLSGNHGWHELKLVKLDGGIQQAKGLEVHWLRPVPPLRHMNAQMRFIDPDRISIKYQGGYQTVYPAHKITSDFHKLSVPDGEMLITGLDDHDERGIIMPAIHGKLEDLLSLLAEPRLRLLSRHPLTFKHPSGDVSVQLHIALPLKKKVKMEQIFIHGHNEITNAYLGNVALGQDLHQASMIVDVDTHHLDLKGKGLFATFPASFHYIQNFYHKRTTDITEKAEAKLQISPDALQQIGFDSGNDFSGNVSAFVNYARHYNRQAAVNLKIDFFHAGLNLPIWHKEKESPAMLSGNILLMNNQLVAIRDLYATGQDLKVQGSMNIVHSIPTQLNISQFNVGRSSGKATLNFPMTKEAFHDPSKGGVRISVKAKTLDISPFIDAYISESKKKHFSQKQVAHYKLPIAATGKYSGPRGRNWLVNLQADKVYYDHDKSLGSVTAYMEYNGIRLRQLSYGMRKPVLVTASLFPQGHYRNFYLDARNFGEILKIIGMSTRIAGGHFILKGRFNDAVPEAPFSGKVKVEPFIIQNAPFALRQLSNLSIYGLFKDQKWDEIKIDALKGNLSLDNGIMQVKDGRVYNNALGATLQGHIDLDQALLDLQGTIVPVYGINRLFAHIPAVGKLFVPEKGGGFIAVPFSIEGKFMDPQMTLHSSQILTPGVLRQLFLKEVKQ